MPPRHLLHHLSLHLSRSPLPLPTPLPHAYRNPPPLPLLQLPLASHHLPGPRPDANGQGPALTLNSLPLDVLGGAFPNHQMHHGPIQTPHHYPMSPYPPIHPPTQSLTIGPRWSPSNLPTPLVGSAVGGHLWG